MSVSVSGGGNLPCKDKHDVEEEVQACAGDLFGLDGSDERVRERARENEEDPEV